MGTNQGVTFAKKERPPRSKGGLRQIQFSYESEFLGELGGDRTHDTLIKSQVVIFPVFRLFS